MPSIEEALKGARDQLLDPGLRNRLISTPRGRSRSTSIEILDESAEQVWERIVAQRKTMSFAPSREDDDDEVENESLLFEQPADEADNTEVCHTDDKLQTRLASKTLQTRLLRLFYDARTFEEEQGVNILFLAIGFVKWFEDEKSDEERYAPLLLAPVRLVRTSVGAKFKIEALDDDISTNLSLQAMLKERFNVNLPEVPEQDIVPGEYFSRVRAAISGQKRWEVRENELVLWFFSFTKFLMFRDLDPKTWPQGKEVSQQPNIGSILGDGFREEPPILDDDDPLDAVLDPASLFHVVDADSSQSVVIEEVRRGQHLVVQGPPGTGKSQTITNVIAAAVKEGKKVLFVAEKMAALDVVKNRMDKINLGGLCLELHSNKSNKKAVLAEIKRTLASARPRVANLQEQIDELRDHRDRLNQHAAAIHTPLQPASVSAFQAMGKLVQLHAAGVPLTASGMLESPLSWSKRQFQDRLAYVRDAAEHLRKLGSPRQHPWRGVGLRAVLRPELEQFLQQCSALESALARLTEKGSALADVLGNPHPATARELSSLAILSSYLSKAPPLDPQAIAHSAWGSQLEQIQSLVAAGAQAAELKKELSGILEPHALNCDVGPARKQMVLHGRSWLRWFYGDYRKAISLLKEICQRPPPTALHERVALLDRLSTAQKAQREVEAGSELGRQAFGTFWQGENSNWDQLRAIAAWVAGARDAKMSPQFRSVLSRLADRAACDRLLKEITADFGPSFSGKGGSTPLVQSIIQSLELDPSEAFATPDIYSIPFVALRERLSDWQRRSESIHDWINFRLRLERLKGESLAGFASSLHSGETQPQNAVDRLSLAYHSALIAECYRQFPALQEFSGDSHESLRNQFQRLDRLRIELARKEVELAHYQSLPKANQFGEMAKLRAEMEKKQRHWPIRKLIRETGHALQAIKPVFMMSPTSIAQFLEPGAIEFDLLVIDEASQVRPVEALGAMARCKQIVVVGDDKQMPPTSFFGAAIGGGDDGSDDDSTGTRNLESVLGLCIARNIRPRMLQWHYRSLHQSLISVSNLEFYDNRLYVIPNPEPKMDGFGLQFHYLADGCYDRGGKAINEVDARHVAQAVMEHARTSPGLSLGVGAFSLVQRDAILDELERLRREDSSCEAFFGSGDEEPFFVKNLENLQGDERDVIFISVGFGPDKDGFITMGFGPLSLDGGERRLNVLISRARRRCEVFTSLRADDINLDRARSRGAAVLKRFLKFAETGFLDAETRTDREHGSEFELQVAKALEGYGYKVEPQVGVAGFFIDLAVKDPTNEGRYVLGIECDGATYHSARWARDRDRLRQEVLESRGWRIHRIWGTDWFRQPNEQLKKLLAAVELAKTPYSPPSPPAAKAPGNPREDHAEDEEAEPEPEADAWIVDELGASPYQEAQLNGTRIDTSRPLHEAPMTALAEVAWNVVRVEGPIHREEVARRISGFFGAMRTTKKMISAVDAALLHSVRMGKLLVDREFYTFVGQPDTPVRSRAAVSSPTLRQPNMLPPAELSAALLTTIKTHLGVTWDEAIVATGRLLGFRSAGPQLKQVIVRELDRLLLDNVIRRQDERLFAEV
jgi:very-short-patch-repair endonuclease